MIRSKPDELVTPFRLFRVGWQNVQATLVQTELSCGLTKLQSYRGDFVVSGAPVFSGLLARTRRRFTLLCYVNSHPNAVLSVPLHGLQVGVSVQRLTGPVFFTKE
jgi:hypothetical protein